jgi:hypothetical protein
VSCELKDPEVVGASETVLRYRYRYLDGWREKETRAALAFGRCFEKVLAAYFRGEDCGVTLFKEWGAFRDSPFAYKNGENWDRMVHQPNIKTFVLKSSKEMHGVVNSVVHQKNCKSIT